jgi:hypothetical protein
MELTIVMAIDAKTSRLAGARLSEIERENS